MSRITANTSGVLEMARIGCVWHGVPPDHDQLKSVYRWVRSAWSTLDNSSLFLNAKGSGIVGSRKLMPLDQLDAKVDSAEFSQLEYLSLESQLHGFRDIGHIGAYFSLSKRGSHFDVQLDILPAVFEFSGEEAERHLLRFASQIAGSYGYVKWTKGPGFRFYAASLSGGDPALEESIYEDHNQNLQWWQPGLVGVKPMVLRDVFPINLLTEWSLGLPYGSSGLSLEDWIRADPSGRGDLTWLDGAKHAMMWRPPIARIPEIRTQLFLAGLLFYWKHFMPDQSEHRDFSQPFTPPDVVPELFRGEFYQGKNPQFTR